MKTIMKLVIMLIIIPQIFTACRSHTFEENGNLTIAVSIIPQETFVREIAGDCINIVTLIPPGKSPANYAPSPQELEHLSHSSIYFTIGVPAEQASILPRLEDINNSIKTIDMAEEVKEIYPEREFSPGQRDPHVWLSPKRVVIMVETISRELSDMDPENEDTYQKNAQIYIEKLKALDEELENTFSKMGGKAFIIYHPSLGYFADDYGLNMISVQSEGKDATPDDLENVMDMAIMHHINTVFYQAEIDSRQSRVIAEEISGEAVQIAPLAPDYIDNLKKIANDIIGSVE